MIKAVTGLLITVLLCNNDIFAQAKPMSALPHVLVYKTRKNYRNRVPVMLSPDKTKVISYPGPQDIKTGGAFALPVLLHKGYLLDRRGVGINSAFTRYTYKEYSKLKNVPSPEVLMHKLMDRNPMVVVYDCGRRNDAINSVKQLNMLIDKKQLAQKCKEIKLKQ